MVNPLPKLRARDFGGGHILHEVVDGRRAVASQPCIEVLQRHVDIGAHAHFRHLAALDFGVQKLVVLNVHLGAQPLLLVGAAPQHGVEDLQRSGHQVGVSHPGAVAAVGRLALLVLTHARQRVFCDFHVAPVGDEGRHAANCVRAALVARLDHALGVGAHEGNGHRHLRAVGQDHALELAELLDDAEDVVPAPGIEARTMVAQLEKDFVHLHRAQDRLDEHRGAHRALGYPQRLLRMDEDVVPEARLMPALELGQVEVGAAAARKQFLRVAQEVEAEVEEARADWLAIHGDVLLNQVPAAWPHQQRGYRLVEAVDAPIWIGEGNCAPDRIGAVDLPLDDILPRGRERVLKVGHEDLCARVERVDHHLALGRAGDLDTAVVEIGRGGGNLPGGVAHGLGFGGIGGHLAGVNRGLPAGARGEQFDAARVEGAVQVGHESQRLGREHRVHGGRGRAQDGDAGREVIRHGWLL